MSTKELWDSLWRCPYLLSFYVKYILRECGTSGEDVSVNAVICYQVKTFSKLRSKFPHWFFLDPFSTKIAH